VIDRRDDLNIISSATAEEGFKDVLLMFRLALLTEQRGQEVRLAFTVHFSRLRAYGARAIRPGSVDLFRDKGIRPLALVLRVNDQGSLPAALMDYANGRQGVSASGYVTKIEMTMFPAP